VYVAQCPQPMALKSVSPAAFNHEKNIFISHCSGTSVERL
jgi:hypothetical protein